ncbi:hypothetical protein [Pseudomonas gessardii]|uniref:hypothetical protein n=1 Tax=Pseudomonas gessardii TaxID=78544 RepID=UPI001475DFA6|nr:hypothetical protein [Pseudomonas gessardii]NNA69453.1 hypothetical protein [Pseudomonas gessardii]
MGERYDHHRRIIQRYRRGPEKSGFLVSGRREMDRAALQVCGPLDLQGGAMKLVGWKTGAPDNNRMVTVLRELSNGQRFHCVCWYSSLERRWVTHDGIYIGGVLGWRDVK